MSRILHITPHLGGGVGKALSGLVRRSTETYGHRHGICTLEPLEKTQFADILDSCGCAIHQAPSAQALRTAAADADIVQVEFWNHPAIVRALCRGDLPPMRLLAWCHISGLGSLALPWGLVETANAFVFTSPCSLALLRGRPRPPRIDVVSSGGGMDEMPPRTSAPRRGLTAGYLGSLNFSKLHPDYVQFRNAITWPDFSVRMIGDEVNRGELQAQCRALNRPGLLEFLGYRPDVAQELNQLDVLIYLLNPDHYGTAENTLLEAMAMGVVPVVLDNPAERHIVEHGKTGFIIHTPAELAETLNWLQEHPEERTSMAARASATVRERHTYARMAGAFDRHYRQLMAQDKQDHAFSRIFGATPAEWFLAFQPSDTPFSKDGSVTLPPGSARASFYDKTKGSVFHFLRYCPDDAQLASWRNQLLSRNHEG